MSLVTPTQAFKMCHTTTDRTNWNHLDSLQKGSNCGSLMTMEGNLQIYTKTGYYKVCDTPPADDQQQHTPLTANKEVQAVIRMVLSPTGEPGSHQVYKQETYRADEEGSV